MDFKCTMYNNMGNVGFRHRSTSPCFHKSIEKKGDDVLAH